MHPELVLRRSRRARRLRIVVAPGRPVEVVVPRGVARADVDRFVAAQRGWIERTLARQAARLGRLGLDRPGVVWVAGEPVPVAPDGARPVAVLRDGRLLVGGGSAEAVERWYRREARSRLEAVVTREAARLGLAPGRVSVRDQRSRWGSCSPSGTLSFSWRLLLAPARVLEYVAVHELCHLRHPNHSRAFWDAVTAARPTWRADAGWLREHGDELQAYRPAVALTRA